MRTQKEKNEEIVHGARKSNKAWQEGGGVQQPRMNPNRNSKRRREGQRNWLMLHLLLRLLPFTASAHVSFLLFVSIPPPLPLFTTSSFPHSHYPNPRKYSLLGKTYIIEKLLLPAFWRTFTELDFVAAGKEPKNKKELNNKAVKQKQLPNHKTITYKQQQQQQHIKRWL